MPGFGLKPSAVGIELEAVESMMFHALEFSSTGNSTMKLSASSNQKMREAMYPLRAQCLPNRPCRLRLRIVKIGDSIMHQDGHGHDEHLLEFPDLLPMDCCNVWKIRAVATDTGRQM